ncbi:CRAL-TRIO domain-containing protein [Entophlyctis helioformis]|nr:CRAL-TRIO domain-containing protein [Entophlyctis helioformis]
MLSQTHEPQPKAVPVPIADAGAAPVGAKAHKQDQPQPTASVAPSGTPATRTRSQPVLAPFAGDVLAVPTPAALTAEQTEMLALLKAHVPGLLARNDPVQLAKEQRWADDACLLRYLRATKWNYNNAVARLTATLAWRREYKPDEIPDDEVMPEALTGKEVFCGFDNQGRPVFYLSPARENTTTYDRQLRFVVYNLEKMCRLLPPGVEAMSVVVDYENVSMRAAPPLSISRRFLQVIGDHYPERMGTSFIVNPTWYLSMFFGLIGPFLDPVTRSKLYIVDPKTQGDLSKGGSMPTTGMGGWTDIRQHIPAKYLWKEFGGDLDYEWNFDEYWAALKNV